MLDREEYVEQAYFFRVLRERLGDNVPMQDLLASIRDEVLATTKLPLAIDYMLAELKHSGVFWPAMERLGHYFTPFQTYLAQEAENERGRFDFRVALEILEHEADYRAKGMTRQGLFLYQFETLCRNRLRYDPGLGAMAKDAAYDADWRSWILTVRRQIGLMDLSDMIYVRSKHYLTLKSKRLGRVAEPEKPVLFGEKEGKIALANRRKNPLLLFSALQRHLGYPAVPRPKAVDLTHEIIPQLIRSIERLEARIKLLEEEQKKGAIDLSKFYGGQAT